MEVYTSRYLARKNTAGRDIKIVKVEGGYAVMEWSDYNIWKNQK